jgi:hypothetical protein
VTFVETELLMSLTVAQPVNASAIDNKNMIPVLFIACPPHHVCDYKNILC